MNRILVFVAGIAVGISVTLALQQGVDDAAMVAELQAKRLPEKNPPIVERVESREPPPAAAPVLADPIRPEAVAPTLEQALDEVQGDVESLVVKDETLIGGRAGQLLAGGEFSRFVQALSRSPSAGASEHHQLLFDEYHRLPSVRSGAVIVQSLACGRRVCAASLVGYDAASVDQAWFELTGRPVEAGPMMRSSNGLEITMDDGVIIGAMDVRGPNGIERRLVITVDPAVRSITSGFEPVDPERLRGGG